MTEPTYLPPLNQDLALQKKEEIEEVLKQCTKCGEWKSLESFSRVKKGSENRRSECKACNKKYYKEHQEQILRNKRETYDAESKKAYNQIYRIKNLDRLLEKDREYTFLHRDEKRVYNTEYNLVNKESIKKQKLERRERDIQTLMFKHAKGRAEKQGIPFTIVEKDIPIPEFCPVLGIPLRVGKGKLHAGSPTVDRLIPALGYVPENVAVISHRANTIKNNGTVEEHRAIADWMETRQTRLLPKENHD